MLPTLKEKLAVTDLASELLVYDAQLEKAHCFSSVGREVFLACSEKGSYQELVQRVAGLSGVVDAECAVEESLRQMAEEGLLQDSVSDDTRFDRRRFLAAVGVAAAPILLSSFAPSPLHAASCKDCLIQTSGPNIGAPVDCASCNGGCPDVGCGATSICCFEYVIASVSGALVFPAGTDCATYHTSEHGPFGANYLCRSGLTTSGYQVNNTYRVSCQVARDFVLSQPGSHLNERYYCCNCDGTSTAYSCPTT